MAKLKLGKKIEMDEILLEMSEGNPGALTCMMGMMQTDIEAILDILYLDELEIYGPKLYMLWNDCCGRNFTKLKETIQAFRAKKFTKEEIHANLNGVRAIPFIK